MEEQESEGSEKGKRLMRILVAIPHQEKTLMNQRMKEEEMRKLREGRRR